jgi:glucan phosphoethanolaminetransferase (alkaline phosphatase superfamily)
MPEPSSHRALASSTAGLLVALGCIVLLLPPLVEHTVASVPRVVAVGLTLACAICLHWVFLGVAVRRMTRPVIAWVALAVLLFPIGGAMALILLSWFADEAASPQPAAHHV